MTPKLESFGFTEGSDEAHRQRPLHEISSRTFFERALSLLGILKLIVIKSIVPDLEQLSGKWHPLGFMVFPLGIHNELGSLRLHIWPKGHRMEIPNGSGIHDHGWHIASIVVAGTYRDSRFDIEATGIYADTSTLPPDVYRVFQAVKTAGQPDTLTTDGSTVRASLIGGVIAELGKTHTLKPGEFHLPVIPKDKLAATLVLDSPSTGIKPRILIRRSCRPFQNPRAEVTRKEKEMAKMQILAS